jgi:mono/diheme cytochrome c family protein
MKRIPKILLVVLGVLALVFLAIQLAPVQRTNPPVTTQVRWDSPQTQALFDRACADCHSNLTRWPWYSYVAPVSWLVAHDVNEGREKFNISALGSLSASRQNRLGREIAEQIEEGEMPMAIYLPMHPEASLSAAEKAALIQGLQATLAQTMR